MLDDDALYTQVRADLETRYPQTLAHGRHSTLAEVLLSLLIVKHLYHWSYRKTEERVADSLVPRWFCRVYFQSVPDATTLVRWVQAIQPATPEALNGRVVHLAREARVAAGRKLRIDSTAVQTVIHYPTDSSLLAVRHALELPRLEGRPARTATSSSALAPRPISTTTSTSRRVAVLRLSNDSLRRINAPEQHTSSVC